MALLSHSHSGSSDDMTIVNPMQNLTGNPMMMPISSLDGFIEEFEGDLGQKTAYSCKKRGRTHDRYILREVPL